MFLNNSIKFVQNHNLNILKILTISVQFFFGFSHISHARGGYVLYQIDLPSCRMDHDLIYGSMRFPVPNSQSDEVFYYRDYSHVSMESLANDFNHVDWSLLYCSPSVDFQVSFFSETMRGLFGLYVLLRRETPKSRINPWYNVYIERAIIDRNLAYRMWLSNRTDELRNLYRSFRNRVHTLVRTAKRNYMGRLLNPNLPDKSLWRNLDFIGLRDKENAFLNIDPNRLNEFFSSVKTGPTPLTRPLNAGSVFDFPTFSFRCVNPKEVFDSIYHIKSDSVGLDGIPLKFVKLVIGSALPLISTYIFNSSITPGSFSTE
jgi:hypothetical protein